MIKLFLFDIEGTTTDINFVHKVLFPYSHSHLKEFVLNHVTDEKVVKAIESVRMTVREEEKKELTTEEVISKLEEWIKTDRKHGALKEIQGFIWDMGYSKNAFKGHVYEDVKPFFEEILKHESKVGIYSSGSVHAQKLIFGYSEVGDLTPLISYYFDTHMGPKRDPQSYLNISKETQIDPKEIHFFSDIPEELAAAKKAGFGVTHVVREGTKTSDFEGVKDFYLLADQLENRFSIQ